MRTDLREQHSVIRNHLIFMFFQLNNNIRFYPRSMSYLVLGPLPSKQCWAQVLSCRVVFKTNQIFVDYCHKLCATIVPACLALSTLSQITNFVARLLLKFLPWQHGSMQSTLQLVGVKALCRYQFGFFIIHELYKHCLKQWVS